MAIGFLIIFVLLNNIKSNYYEDKNYLGGFKFVVSFKLFKSAECQQNSKNKNRKIS